MDISAISALRPAQPAMPSAPVLPDTAATDGEGGFVKLLSDVAGNVDKAQHEADEQVAQLAAGKTDNIHQVMLALGKAEISFNYMLEVRNKLVDAYKDVMRMSL